jgi:hypothetical protein
MPQPDATPELIKVPASRSPWRRPNPLHCRRSLPADSSGGAAAEESFFSRLFASVSE